MKTACGTASVLDIVPCSRRHGPDAMAMGRQDPWKGFGAKSEVILHYGNPMD